ncbi:hypothetical protein EYZ11_013073 [Aspergillus tanneri]|uniref:Uncharacterized protein n=1 Tax=Aspergillus tanneri TaxID=1220188 RepID=A0A4S3IZ40_9EURO|nr:hypothetical protein EYZ11_013073 [Aspergillus tanneri]
MAREKYLVKA